MPAFAAPDTWVGNTDATFATGSNWGAGTTPVSGDALSFSTAGTAGATLNDNLYASTSTVVSGITFNSGASAYTISGGTFNLAGALINNGSNLETINDAIFLTNTAATVTTNSSGGNVSLGSVTSGAAYGSNLLIAAGTGTLSLTGSADNSYLNLQVNSGATAVLAKASNAVIHSVSKFTVNSGGTLMLGGTGGNQFYFGNTDTVSSGGVLDLAGATNNGGGTINISGTGISGGGAIVNSNLSSDATLNAALQLQGNTSIGGSGDVILTGVISGGYGLTMNGLAYLTLSGANTFTGPVAVNNGAVIVTNGNASATAAQALGESGVLTLGVAGTSSGALVYNGTSAATLAQDITAQGIGADTIVNNAASSANVVTLSGSIVNNSSALFIGGGTAAVNVTGVISGAAAGSDLNIISGGVSTGTTTLSAANTYNGATWISSSGVLVDGTNNALPTSTALNIGTYGAGGVSSGGAASEGTFDLGGFNQTVATLNTVGTGPFTSDIVTNSGSSTGTLTVTNGGTFAGVIKDGSTNKTAFAVTSGTMTLSGTNTYSGGTTVSGGELIQGVASGLGASTGALTVSGGASVDINNFNTTVGSLNFGAGGGSVLDTGATGTFAIGSSTGTITLAASATGTIQAPVNVGFSGIYVNSGAGSSLLFNNTVSGGKLLEVAGSGTTTLAGSADNGYLTLQVDNGATVILAKVASTSAIHAVSSFTVQSGGTVKFGGTGANQFYTGNNPTINSGGVLDMNGTSNTGGGTILVSGTGINNGGAIVNSVAATTATLNAALKLTGNISVGGAGTTILSGSISDNTAAAGDSLTMVGTGTVQLSGSNSYDGGTTVSSGVLQLGNNAGLGASTNAVTVNGGTLDLDSYSPTVSAINLTGTGTGGVGALINSAASTTSTLSTGLTLTGNTTVGGAGNINASGGVLAASGSYSLTKAGSGTLTLGASSASWTGSTIVSGGVLKLSSNTSLGATTNALTIQSGATLDINNQSPVVGSVAFGTGGGTLANVAGYGGAAIQVGSSTGNITVAAGASAVVSAVINNSNSGILATTGAGSNLTLYTVQGSNGGNDKVEVAGAGTTTFGGSGTNNGYLTVVVDNGATAIMSKTGVNGAGTTAYSNATVNSGGILQMGTGAANGQQYNGGTTTVSSGGVIDLNGTTQALGALKIQGTGISSGGALVNSSTASTGTLTSAVTLQGNTSIGGAGNLALTGIISGSGDSLTKVGTGKAFLAAANTYTGGTTVSAGTLYANNSGSSSTGTGAVTVNSGGTLAGSGLIAPTSGGVTVNAGGTLSSGGLQTAYAVANGGNGNVNGTGTGGGLTISNPSSLSSDLSINGGAALTFALGSSTAYNGGSGALNFANPNTNSTYLNFTGSTVDQIFSNTTVALTINLIDLTNGSAGNSLTLRSQNPYLLIQTALGNDSDFANLVTTGGTGANGYVLGVSNGSGGYTPFAINAYDINGNQINTSTNLEGLRLYLYNGDLEVVPEPSTYALMLGGVGVLLLWQRRRKQV